MYCSVCYCTVCVRGSGRRGGGEEGRGRGVEGEARGGEGWERGVEGEARRGGKGREEAMLEMKELSINCHIESDVTGVVTSLQAMAACHPGAWEYQLESVMEHAARMRGAWSLSFPPVVGGGARGNHIHYIRNDQQLM